MSADDLKNTKLNKIKTTKQQVPQAWISEGREINEMHPTSFQALTWW